MWRSVPKNPERLNEWLEAKRAWLDEILLEFEGHEGRDVMIMREPPRNDLFIEWIYTIDLDNLVFHIDSNPVFSLTSLPQTEGDFLAYIGSNSYGHRSYEPKTPLKYQFCANWSTPPAVDESVLEEYTSLQAQQSGDVLELPESTVTVLRRRYVETFIGALMREEAVYKNYLSFLEASKREDLSAKVLELTKKLLCVVLTPPMFSTEARLSVDLFQLLKTSGLHLPRDEKELLWWMRDNLCIYISTHLDDPKNFQASIATIVKEMQAHHAKDATRPKFGVVFSITKCTVVRLDSATSTVIHSPALDFLPSWHASSPHTEPCQLITHSQAAVPKWDDMPSTTTTATTEGITLLARLCEYLDDLADGCPGIKPPLDACQLRLPVELVFQVLECVPEPEAIFTAARASSILKAVAKPILMQPYFNGQFLTRGNEQLTEAQFLCDCWDDDTQRFPPGERYSPHTLYSHADYFIDALRGT